EFSLPVLAALLTIIGYSVNDTIVAYDRLRENRGKMIPKGRTFAEQMNDAVNQTLSRTVLTSLTTFFSAAVLLFFGGKTLEDFAASHRGQQRASGEPYLSHPLEVATLLVNFKMDVTTVTAGLLHDVLEDTKATKEDLEREFGADIAELVDGVTKIGKLAFSSREERQAENFRKMLVAMARDLRVLMIKLADRLHNMRTLDYLPPDRAKKIAQETLDIYAQ